MATRRPAATTLGLLGAALLIGSAFVNWLEDGPKGTGVPIQFLWSRAQREPPGSFGSLGFVCIVLCSIAVLGVILRFGVSTGLAGALGTVFVLRLITPYRVEAGPYGLGSAPSTSGPRRNFQTVGLATMPGVPRTYSTGEIAVEAASLEDRVRWLAEIGLLKPDVHGRFTFGAVLAVRMVSALIESGISSETIEHAAREGLLAFQRMDEYLPYEPGRRSERTFAAFQAAAGQGAELLPAVYEVLGLPKPDPSTPIHVDEEAMFERFLDIWRSAPDDDVPLRAARLMAQGTRASMLGWADLVDEQLAEPARRRLYRGDLDAFPDEVRVIFMKATNLAPEMFLWLAAQYLEQRSVNGIVEGFERFLASRGLARPPDPLGPPAIAFVDLTGFTRLAHERGDESAAKAATSLQRRADEAAGRYGGRLVKLLGDGAMLRLTDATAGLNAALDLVETMSDHGALSSHAGVHSGPVIERDQDVFGQTVNLASRIADVAGPGEVLTTEAVVEAARSRDATFGFERADDAVLEGLPRPVPLFNVTRSRSGVEPGSG